MTRRKHGGGAARHLVDNSAIDAKVAQAKRLLVMVAFGENATPRPQSPRPIEDASVCGPVFLNVMGKDDGDFRYGRRCFHVTTIAQVLDAVKQENPCAKSKMTFRIWGYCFWRKTAIIIVACWGVPAKNNSKE